MSNLKSRSLFRGLSVVAVAALVVTGCSSGTTTNDDASSTSASTDSGSSDPITIAVINKQGTQQYFVDQADGSLAAAEELGDVTVTVQDVQLDANAAINAVNTAIAQGVDGILITVPDASIGPEVIKLAEEAGILLMATNDTISDADGNPAPYVGFSGFAMGQDVGGAAAELYLESGWDTTNTAIISIQKQDLPTCVERGEGELDAFTAAVGAGNIPQVIDLGTDAGTPQALDRTGALVTANPDVENWVVWGCNDESVTGGVLALQNAGFGADNVIGVGLGAYLVCKDWQAGAETGNKAALALSGFDVGRLSLELMVESIRTGTPPPADSAVVTKIVDASTWEAEGVVCT